MEVTPISMQKIPSGKVRLKISRSDSLLYFGAKAEVKINGVVATSLWRSDSFEGIYSPGPITVSVDEFLVPGSYALKIDAEEGNE